MTDPTTPTPATDASLAAAEVESTPTQAATPPAAPEAGPSIPEAPALDIPAAPPIAALIPAPVSALGVSPSLSVTAPAAGPDLATASAQLARALASNDQRQVTPGNLGIPTQVANPARTSWRTFVQSLIGLLIVAVPLANLVLANVNDFLHSQTFLVVSPKVYALVNGGLLVTAFVVALVTRIMLVPGVAAFIERYVPFLAPIAQNGKHSA